MANYAKYMMMENKEDDLVIKYIEILVDFAELISVSVKTLQRWDREGILKIEGDEEIAKELQDRN